MTLQPRDYQIEADRSITAAFREVRRVVLVAPTGAGKGDMGLLHATRRIYSGERILWFTYRRELIPDTSERLTRIGVPHGVLLAGHPRLDPLAPIQVGSIQTLLARDERPPASLLISDECHHITTESSRELITAYPDAQILGLTATPERADRTALGNVFERMIVAATARDLIARGHLCPVVTLAPVRRRDTLAMSPGDALSRFASGRRVILFAGTTAHARSLAAELGGTCIEGDTPPGARREAFERFAAGELLLLTNVYCLSEGWDCPPAEVCLLARRCGSASTFLQMVGRVMRPSAGKLQALLIDLFGVVHEHGLPDDEREYCLTGEAIRTHARLPALMRCRTCLAVFRPRATCPLCGKAPSAPEAPRVGRAAISKVLHTVPRQYKQDYFNYLCRRRHANGYAYGWVAHMFRARYGHWPSGFKEETHHAAH